MQLSRGVSPQEYTDEQSAVFRRIFDGAGISYDRFIRTTEPDHRAAVESLWRALVTRGHIRKGKHSGWYCVADECFVPDSQTAVQKVAGAVESRVSTESGRQVEWAQEQNYLFELSVQRQHLQRWLSGADGGRSPVTPPGAASWLSSVLSNDRVEDGQALAEVLSVSRPATRVSWGIAVPTDHEDGSSSSSRGDERGDALGNTIYVWLDALCNYLTAAGYGTSTGESSAAQGEAEECAAQLALSPLWPPDHQIVGKDILKFHGLYWPAFLAAAGLALPARLHAHAHWQADDGTKMSKTTGNVVCPATLLRSYGAEPLRYYLLCEGPHGGKDAAFSETTLVQRCNADLANTLGNLLLRVTSPKISPSGQWPVAELEQSISPEEAVRRTELQAAIAEAHQMMMEGVPDANVGKGLKAVLGLLQLANVHFQACAPWKLSAAPTDASMPGPRERCIWSALEALRVGLILLQPAIPVAASSGLDMLGVSASPQDRTANAAVYGYEDEGRLGPRQFVKPHALFSKLENLGVAVSDGRDL